MARVLTTIMVAIIFPAPSCSENISTTTTNATTTTNTSTTTNTTTTTSTTTTSTSTTVNYTTTTTNTTIWATTATTTNTTTSTTTNTTTITTTTSTTISTTTNTTTSTTTTTTTQQLLGIIDGPATLMPCDAFSAQLSNAPKEGTQTRWHCRPSGAPLCLELLGQTGTWSAWSTLEVTSKKVTNAAAAVRYAGQTTAEVEIAVEAMGSAWITWLGFLYVTIYTSTADRVKFLPGRRAWEATNREIVLDAEVHTCSSGWIQSPARIEWEWKAMFGRRQRWIRVQAPQSKVLSLSLPLAELRGIGMYSIRGAAYNSTGLTPYSEFQDQVEVVKADYPPIELVVPHKVSSQCSFDINIAGALASRSVVPVFSWVCLQGDNETAYAWLVSEASSQTLQVQANSLGPGEYVFIATVTYPESNNYKAASLSATAHIEVVAAPFPSIALTNLPREVSGEVPLSLVATVQDTRCPAPKWHAWWMVSTVEPAYAWADEEVSFVSESSSANLSVYMQPPLPVAPGSYVLRIVLSDAPGVSPYKRFAQDSGGPFMFDSEVIIVDEPPAGGSCVVSPSLGYAGLTPFQLSSIGWIDDDLPLHHRFMLCVGCWTCDIRSAACIEETNFTIDDVKDRLLPISEWIGQEHFTTSLGMESVPIVSVRDSLGSHAFAIGSVQVQRNASLASNESHLLDVVLAAAAGGVAGEVVSSVEVVADEAQVAGVAFSYPTGLSFVNAMAQNVLDVSVDALSSYSRALGKVLKLVTGIPVSTSEIAAHNDLVIKASASVQNLAEHALTLPLRESTQELRIVVDSLLDGVSSAVGFGQVCQETARGFTRCQTSMSKDISLSTNLQHALAATGDLLAGLTQVGSMDCAESFNVNLCVASHTMEELAQSSLTIESFVIPPQGASQRRLQAACSSGVSLQHMRFSSANPFSPHAPEEPAHPGAVATLFNITAVREEHSEYSVHELGVNTTCCTVRGKDVQTMSVRACGADVAISNSTPIRFEASVPGLALYQRMTSTKDLLEETYDPTLQDEFVLRIPNETRACYYWDIAALAWSTEGCVTLPGLSDDGKYITCECTHLSTFAGAYGSRVASYGKNQVKLVEPEAEVSLDNTHFLVFFVWMVLLYLPLLIFQCIDWTDYDWNSQRDDLFLELHPRTSHEVMCTLCPAWQVCDGMLSSPHKQINCSKLYRAYKYYLHCRCILSHVHVPGSLHRKHEEPPPPPKRRPKGSYFITSLGSEVSAMSDGRQGNHLLCIETIPPVRQQVLEYVTSLLDDASLLGDHDAAFADDNCIVRLLREYFGVYLANWRFGAIKQALRGARELKKGIPLGAVGSKLGYLRSGKNKAEQLLHMEFCHDMIGYNNMRHWRALSCKGSYSSAQKREATTSMNAMAQTLDTFTRKVDQPKPCAVLPPLLAMRVQIVNGHEVDLSLWGVPDLINGGVVCSPEDSFFGHGHAKSDYFVWPGEFGELIFHRAEKDKVSHSWRLEAPGESRTIALDREKRISLRTEEDEHHSASASHLWLDMPVGGDVLISMLMRDHIRGDARETIEDWSAMLMDTRRWPAANRGGEVYAYLTKRPYGWLARARTLKNGKGIGLILTEVHPNTHAEELGLQPGMVLLRVGACAVAQMESQEIANMLITIELPVTVVFSKVLEPDFNVSLDSLEQNKDVDHPLSPGPLPFKCEGMLIKEVTENGRAFGLQEGDEVLSIKGFPTYGELGDLQHSADALENLRTKIWHGKIVEIGIYRSGVEKVPPYLAGITSMPSVFRFMSGMREPHTSCSPFVVSTLKQEAFMASAWFSHGGAVLTIQPHAHSMCLGVYIDDITNISQCEQLPFDESNFQMRSKSRRPSCWNWNSRHSVSTAVAPDVLNVQGNSKEVQDNSMDTAANSNGDETNQVSKEGKVRKDETGELQDWRIQNLLQPSLSGIPEDRKNSGRSVRIQEDEDGASGRSNGALPIESGLSQWQFALLLKSTEDGGPAQPLFIGCLSEWSAQLLRSKLLLGLQVIKPKNRRPDAPIRFEHQHTFHDREVTTLTSAGLICECGNFFLDDSAFCRKCGKARPKDEATTAKETADKASLDKEGCLDVGIWSCTNLAPSEGAVHVDPYIRVTFRGLGEDAEMTPDRDTTGTILGSLNPIWTCHLFFQRAGKLKDGAEVVFELWDGDPLGGAVKLDEVFAPLPHQPGIYYSQMRLNDGLSVLTSSLQWIPSETPKNTFPCQVHAPFPDPLLAYVGIFNCDILYAEQLARCGPCNPFVVLSVPVHSGPRDSGIIRREIWSTNCSNSARPNAFAVFMEGHSFHMNFIGAGPPPGENVIVSVFHEWGHESRLIGQAEFPVPTQPGTVPIELRLLPRIQEDHDLMKAFRLYKDLGMIRSIPVENSDLKVARSDDIFLPEKSLPILHLEACWQEPFTERSHHAEEDLVHTAVSSHHLGLVSEVDASFIVARREYTHAHEAWHSSHARRKPPAHLRWQANEVAKRLTYQYWTAGGICGHIWNREHFIFSLSHYMSSLTRCERWGVWATTLQAAFLVPSLVLHPECFMVPAPIACVGDNISKGEALWRQLVSAETLLLGAFSLAVVEPVPWFLEHFFKKAAVEEKVTRHGRKVHARTWRARTCVGWLVILALNIAMCYSLAYYVSKYNYRVFSQWLAAVLHTIVHRWLTFPLLRTAVFSVIVISSKACGFCDPCLLLCPFIAPVVPTNGAGDEADEEDGDLEGG